jgi:hypothetical protein
MSSRKLGGTIEEKDVSLEEGEVFWERPFGG